MNTPKLWTKDFLLISFVNFGVAFNFYLLMVVISVYAMDNFRSSPGAAGLAASIFVIGSPMARLLLGRWIERIGQKKILYAGLMLNLIMTLLYFGTKSIIFLLFVRLLHGVGHGVSNTATGTVVANIIPPVRRGEGIGYYASFVTLAAALGPSLGIFLSQNGNFKMIFLASAFSSALSLAGAFFLNVPEIKLTEEQMQETKGFKFSSFFEIKALPISIVCGIIYFSYSSVLTFLSTYAKEVQLVDAAGFFFMVVSAAILLSRPVTGRLFDSKGENFLMYPAIFLFGIGMIFVSQAHHGFILLAAGALIGLGLGTIQFGSQTIAIKVTPRHRMGLATATFYILLDSSVGIGPFIFGLFVPLYGYRGVYMGAAVIGLATLLLYYQLHGKKARSEKIYADI